MTHTVESITEMLRHNNKALIRAIVVLNERQTTDEQIAQDTKYHNGMGVRPCHARMITSMANFYASRGYLSPKQLAYWRMLNKHGKMRIEVYSGQLLKVAKEKMEKEAMQVA